MPNSIGRYSLAYGSQWRCSACDAWLCAGWCAGALTDDEGALCLIGAIRAEAGGDQDLATDASAILLDAVRRKFHDESVPVFNDRRRDGSVPARMLREAAGLADARGR